MLCRDDADPELQTVTVDPDAQSSLAVRTPDIPLLLAIKTVPPAGG
jgi:hypothetical protein